EVHGFLEESDGRIWMKGVQLLALFNEEEQRFNIIPNDYRNEQGIQYEHVLYLFEDREKNIWVATRHHGMYRFNPSLQYFLNITHRHPLHDQQGVGSVMSFMELKNGDILTGAWGDGLYRYDQKLRLKPHGLGTILPYAFPSIWNMRASADSNTIWMACQPGLYLFDQAKNKLVYRNPPILQNRTVRQVIEDRQGNLWLGMHGQGVYRWFNPKRIGKDSIVKVEAAGKCMVNQLVLDSKDWLWVSTGGKGLFVFDSHTGNLIRHWSPEGKGADTVLGDAVSGVLEYNDSLVFITTATEFFFYNRHRNTVTRLPVTESLMGAIASHQKDNAGYIWVGTTNALYRFHPFYRSLVMFNRFDGINNDNFVLSATYKRKDGTLLFGNDVSFIHFDPARIKLSERHLPVAFTSMQIGKHELRVDSVLELDRLTLGANDNSITVEFSSLVYSHELLTQYKLDGIDDDWHLADKSQRAMFPFLPPGIYTLRLRTINADGIPSPNHTVLNIYIRSPYYQTWWFYSLLAVVVAFVLFWLDRQRSRRKEALQKVRTDIASGLHEEVNTALNNINILSEIARLKSEKEPQRAKEYLEQINTKSHNMIIALDDMLWSLDPQNDAMDRTISRIREFADALMQRHGVMIELLIDKKVEKLELDMKLRHEAFLLFKEGLRSLVMAGTKLCIVHLAADKGKLLFTIEFENEGCDMQQLNNLLRRRDMESRLHTLKAKLNVQVHKSKSVFLLQLPLAG
ncbi:MAG TPA: two-component regulator propeller domain-containing protein, partial [Flavisolibacter sp.]|nr:two-component regulator propeller domain-containing protein [Flavisolibacter sp.]